MTSRVCCFAVILCLLPITVFERAKATDLEAVTRFVASDSAVGDILGISVSVNGDVALVGASGDDGYAGSVYVARFDGAAWVEEQKLTAPDREGFEFFGAAVSLSDDVALVGAWNDDGSGSVYVYRFDGSTWAYQQKLTASDRESGDAFGISVSLGGDVALVGATGDDDHAGSVYVYRFDGSSFAYEQKLTAGDRASESYFGRSISASGDTAFVGADQDQNLLGAAYVFRFDGSTWVQEQKIAASDGVPGDEFGASVSLCGDIGLVGSRGNDDNGSAYVYRFDGSTWVQEQKIAASDGMGDDFFGTSVSLSGNAALVGAFGDDSATGSAYLYRFDGSTWVQEQKITASDGTSNDAFGASVSLCGDVALIGAFNDDGGVGSAHVFSGASCLDGRVNAGTGSVANTLYVGISAGGSDRTVEIGPEDLLLVTLVAPPAGGNGKFVLHADVGRPNLLTQTLLPFDIGASCFPFLFTEGATPVIVANSIGKTNLLGESQYFGTAAADPPRATTHLLFPGLPIGTVLTFQALMIDPGSASAKLASASNGVIVEFVP